MSLLELSITGGPALRVHHFSIQENMSDMFEVTLVAHLDDPAVDLESLVGQPATFKIVAGTLYAQNMGTRCWKGIVRFVEQTHAQGKTSGLSSYYIQIVPDLYKLTQRTNHRIFQHLSIPDIVKRIFSEWGVTASWEIDSAASPPLEFKVQYGESDYRFVCRLLEEAGIGFMYRDIAGTGGILIMSDRLHNGQPRPALPFVDNPNEAAQKEFVSQMRLGHEIRPGAHIVRDFDFRKPSFRLVGEGTAVAPRETQFELYDYSPGSFLVEGAKGGGTPVADDKGVARHDAPYGTGLATRRLESIRSDKRRVVFATNAVDLSPGVLFTVEDHPNPALSSSTRILCTTFTMDGSPDDEWVLAGHGVVLESGAVYRSPLKTPKPRIFGVQSAAVTGPSGQEIYTDEFGRVRVQFPWDRDGKNDDNSSCWMRVSQGWAGVGYGMMMIPRVGQEVLVTFLDGDPDRPIVTGRVFNAMEVVPYKLPDDKTVSTWKSHSSPSTGGYNEIKFDDRAGSEIVYVQAERDLHKLVKHDEVERTIGNKSTTVVGTLDHVVKGVRKQLIESDDHLHVKLNQKNQVDGSLSMTVSVGKQEKVGQDYAVEAGTEIHVKAGTKLVLEAGTQLTIKGPGGFIDIHSGGIDIVGILVNVNSGGFAGMGKGSQPEAPTDATEAQPKDSLVS